MLAHINDLARFLDSLERSFHHRIRFAHESDHGTVGRLPRIHIQKLHTFNLFHFIGNLLDNRHVAAFAEVRHALDDFFHCISKN